MANVISVCANIVLAYSITTYRSIQQKLNDHTIRVTQIPNALASVMSNLFELLLLFSCLGVKCEPNDSGFKTLMFYL